MVVSARKNGKLRDDNFILNYDGWLGANGAQVYLASMQFVHFEMMRGKDDNPHFRKPRFHEYFQIPVINGLENVDDDKSDFVYWLSLFCRQGAKMYKFKDGVRIVINNVSVSNAISNCEALSRNNLTNKKRVNRLGSFKRFLSVANDLKEVEMSELCEDVYKFVITCQNFYNVNEQLFDKIFKIQDFRKLKSNVAMFYAIMSSSQVKSDFDKTSVSYKNLNSLANIAGVGKNTATSAINTLSKLGCISFVVLGEYTDNNHDYNLEYCSYRYWITDRRHEARIVEMIPFGLMSSKDLN